VFNIAFVTDLPLKPPTLALWKKRVMNNKLEASDKNFSQYIATVRILYTDLSFVLCTMILAVSFNINIVLHLHITVIVEYFDIHSMGI